MAGRQLGEVAFLPGGGGQRSLEVIAENERMVTINGALAIDIHGQVVADTTDGAQFSGIGGAEDFVTGAGLELSDRSLICLPSTYTEERRTALPHRALLRTRGGDHHPASPRRRHSHRTRHRRTGGPRRSASGRGAGGHRRSAVP